MNNGAQQADGLSSLRDEADKSSSPKASIPSAREMHLRWTTDEGLVLFSFPSNLPMQVVADVEELLKITLAGMWRRAQAIEARRAATLGSVHDGPVGTADAPNSEGI